MSKPLSVMCLFGTFAFGEKDPAAIFKQKLEALFPETEVSGIQAERSLYLFETFLLKAVASGRPPDTLYFDLRHQLANRSIGYLSLQTVGQLLSRCGLLVTHSSLLRSPEHGVPCGIYRFSVVPMLFDARQPEPAGWLSRVPRLASTGLAAA